MTEHCTLCIIYHIFRDQVLKNSIDLSISALQTFRNYTQLPYYIWWACDRKRTYPKKLDEVQLAINAVAKEFMRSKG